MKKWIYIAVCIAIVAGLIFFGKNETTSEKFKVGVILPFSGTLAKTGSDAKIALEIAQDNHKDSKIELIFEDDGFVPKNSVTSLNKIISQNEIVAVIGPLNGTSIESVRSIAVENKIPLFTPWGAGNDIGNYVYKNSVEGADEALIMANKVNELGYRRLAIMYLQNDYGSKYLKSFSEGVKNNNGEIVSEEATPFGMTDYRTALTKIKSKKPDAVYLVNTSISIGEILKQSKEIGLETKFLSQYAVESPEILKIAGSSLEGMIYTFPINESNLSKKQEKFIKEYKDRTGEKPQTIAYNIYDIYSLINEGVEKCKEDRVCLSNYIANTDGFDGVGGKFSIKDNKLIRDLFFKTVKDGEFVSL